MHSGWRALRTPDERFLKLPGWDFAPRYRDDLPGFAGLRMHYVDEEPTGAPRAADPPDSPSATDRADVVLCLHGQPTWGYLYRKMMPVFLAAGLRVVVPDLFGFGRSDKPTDPEFYTFSRHRTMLLAFIEALDLTRITLVVQDWGGLLGLTLLHEAPERFSRLLIMNTTLGTGDVELSRGFLEWRSYANSHPDLEVGVLMGRAVPFLSPEERAAYDAPFPDSDYKSGVRRFPNLVPDHPEAEGAALSREARTFLSKNWQVRSFVAIGMRDPVLGPPVMQALLKDIRNCPAPLEVAEGGHFLQEWGAPIAAAALAAWETP